MSVDVYAGLAERKVNGSRAKSASAIAAGKKAAAEAKLGQKFIDTLFAENIRHKALHGGRGIGQELVGRHLPADPRHRNNASASSAPASSRTRSGTRPRS